MAAAPLALAVAVGDLHGFLMPLVKEIDHLRTVTAKKGKGNHWSA